MRKLAILASTVVLAALPALAADKPCSAADASNAEKAMDRVNTWAQMHKAYADFHHCDAKQSVNEAYTDALLRLVVEWKNVDAFAGAMQKDAGFKDFVQVHLTSPSAKDDRDMIYSRAKASCPKGQEAFCTELGAMVKPAAPKLEPLLTPIEPIPSTAAAPAAAPAKK